MSEQYIENFPADSIADLPLGLFKGHVHVVDDPHQLPDLLRVFKDEGLAGFDTETRPNFKKGEKHKVALLQLANSEVSLIIRLHHTHIPPVLKEFLENPGILKIGAALQQDLTGLKNITPFIPGGFVDLQTMSDKYGIKDNSLRKLAANVIGVRISKAQRLTNWEAPLLTDQQLLYAATDAWISYEIYKKLIQVK